MIFTLDYEELTEYINYFNCYELSCKSCPFSHMTDICNILLEHSQQYLNTQ